jgi:pimeloyl-ACP methyl ester carboxylesterase
MCVAREPRGCPHLASLMLEESSCTSSPSMVSASATKAPLIDLSCFFCTGSWAMVGRPGAGRSKHCLIKFTVVAWDAPGAGASSDPPETLGMSGYADLVAGFVDQLGLGRPHVAGLSFGGALALAYYRRHPAAPRSLVLASAYAGWTALPRDAAPHRLQQAMVLAALSPQEFVDALLPSTYSDSTPAEVVEDFGESMLTFHPAGLPPRPRRSMA